MWNSGAAAIVTSVEAMPGPAESMLIAFHSMLSWVSTAPFGRPVVPEVYMITQGSWPRPSAGSGSRRAGPSGASPRSSSCGGTSVAARAARAASASGANVVERTRTPAPESART